MRGKPIPRLRVGLLCPNNRPESRVGAARNQLWMVRCANRSVTGMRIPRFESVRNPPFPVRSLRAPTELPNAKNPVLNRSARGLGCLRLGGIPEGDLAVLDSLSGFSLPPPAAARLVFEVQPPPAVVPFQADLAPAQRNLRIGIEGTDVRPGGRRVLLGIGHRGVVRIRGIARPGVARHGRMIVTHRRHDRPRLRRGHTSATEARHAGTPLRRRQLRRRPEARDTGCIIATGRRRAGLNDGKAWA